MLIPLSMSFFLRFSVSKFVSCYESICIYAHLFLSVSHLLIIHLSVFLPEYVTEAFCPCVSRFQTPRELHIFRYIVVWLLVSLV